jgi:hypothetical protein
MMEWRVGNFDNEADQHNGGGKNERIHKNGSAVPVLIFQMKEQEQQREDERKQCGIKKKAIGKMSAQQCNKRALHAAARAIHSRQCLVRAGKHMMFEPVGETHFYE